MLASWNITASCPSSALGRELFPLLGTEPGHRLLLPSRSLFHSVENDNDGTRTNRTDPCFTGWCRVGLGPGARAPMVGGPRWRSQGTSEDRLPLPRRSVQT